MKKRFIKAFLIGAFALGTLSACGNSSQDSADTMTPSAEIAEETDNQEETDELFEEEADENEAGGQEEADAAYDAGYNCLYGEDGKEIDLEEAYTNFNHALELGNTEANFYLGLLCDWYSIPENDFEKAKAYYEAAGEDNSGAQLALGFLYYNGQGVEQDVEKAQELFDAVIKQGDMGGYLGNAVIAYDKGDYTVALENYNKVLEGSEQVFLAEAMGSIGALYFHGQGIEQDYAQALEWYRKAADLGETDSMINIGGMYLYGQGVEQDYTQALEWYEKAADLGKENAMGWLGYLYYNGLGVEQDYTQALEWFKKGADLGEPSAMNNLAGMYYYGQGVEQDYTQALEWYEKAADLGNTDAMKSLAGMYTDGRGVEVDIDIAQEWYNKAEGAK